MAYLSKFIYSPGGENESGSTAQNSNEDLKDGIGKTPDHPEVKEDKTVIEKIKEALHDWSNKDERDQQFDDTRV